MRVSVFVPAPESGSLANIKRGSGIVAVELRPWTRIDYEGDLYNASNMVTFADRVKRAWQRQEHEYPTIARMVVPAGELVKVGEFDSENGVVEIGHEAPMDADTARDILADWLSVSVFSDRELRCSS